MASSGRAGPYDQQRTPIPCAALPGGRGSTKAIAQLRLSRLRRQRARDRRPRGDRAVLVVADQGAARAVFFSLPIEPASPLTHAMMRSCARRLIGRARRARRPAFATRAQGRASTRSCSKRTRRVATTETTRTNAGSNFWRGALVSWPQHGAHSYLDVCARSVPSESGSA